MKIEDIHELWSKDLTIDRTNISGESARIPELHNKYFKIYMEEGIRLKQLRLDYTTLRKNKEKYYRGKMDIEELKELGWEQFVGESILRADIPAYVDADTDIINMTLKIGIQEEKVSYLESIIKMINNRGFQLKTIVDWEKFTHGSV